MKTESKIHVTMSECKCSEQEVNGEEIKDTARHNLLFIYDCSLKMCS